MKGRTIVLNHFIWLIVCLGGNVFQIIALCQSYFRYEVSSQVTIAFLEKFRVPGMAVCFSYIDVLNWSTVIQGHSDRYQRLLALGNFPEELSNVSSLPGKDEIRQLISHTKKLRVDSKGYLAFTLFNGLTVDQVFKMALEPNVVLNFNRSYTQKTFHNRIPGEFAQVVLIEKLMHSYRLCYNIQFKDSNELTSLSEIFRDHVLNGMLYWFGFTDEIASRVSRIDIKYAPPGSLPRYGFAKDLFTDLNEPVLAVTYRKITIDLLPPPFPTNCKSYYQFKGKGKRRVKYLSSRSECHEKCIYDLSLERYSGLSPGITIDPSFGEETMVAPSIETIIEYSRHFEKSEEICANKCSQLDCKDTHYIPQIYSQLKANGVKLALASYVASDPPISVSTKRILDFTSFITDLASSFNFWLGVSLLSINKFFVDETAKFFAKKPGKITPQSNEIRRISHMDRLILRNKNSKQFQWDWYIVPSDNRFKDFLQF